MTIYVDDMRMEARVGRINGVWSHLISDDPDPAELHDFAQNLGLQRSWFQEKPAGPRRPFPMPHYDVVETKRAAAIKAGAVEIPAGATFSILRRRWQMLELHRALRLVYRERAHLIALAASHQAVTGVVLSTDPEPERADCSTLVTATTTGGQWTWHISDLDLDLVAHLLHVEADDPRAVWDGHDTRLKYQRVSAIARSQA